jgi:hypothetical protein
MIKIGIKNMNKIKSFKLFENKEPIDIVNDIFIPIKDYTVVKINQFPEILEYQNKKSIHISMNFDNCVSDDNNISLWGQKYRILKDDSLISIILAEIFDELIDNKLFLIKKAQVYWLSAGERTNTDYDIKYGGPGLLKKDFDEFDEISDFVESRGNRIRQVKIILLINDINESSYDNYNNIKSDIDLIFLSEIKDIDDSYDIEIYDYNDVLGGGRLDSDNIVVEISKWSSIIPTGPRNRRISFKLDEIEDGIHRILNYMSDMGYTNTYITTKYRAMDDWTQLFMKEGDYTRYKLGPQEWRFDKPISRIKIIFTK